MTYDERDGELRGEVEGVSFSLRRELRGRRGAYLVGALSYPTLGLGLRVQPISLAVRLRGASVRIGDERFDELQHVSGREAAQTGAVLRMLLTALDPFLPLTMDDTSLQIELRDEEGARLRRFGQPLSRLAYELAVARRATPPPAQLAADVDAWRALAQRLGASLCLGAMRIDGSFEGEPARVATCWSTKGGAEHTELVLRPAVALPAGAHIDLRATEGGLPAAPLAALVARLPAGGRELVERISRDARRLCIGVEELRLELAAPLAEPAQATERLGDLSRLARWLRPAQGVYR